jgi:hypothetical protein
MSSLEQVIVHYISQNDALMYKWPTLQCASEKKVPWMTIWSLIVHQGTVSETPCKQEVIKGALCAMLNIRDNVYI